MKLTISRDKLSAALAAVSGVVKGRTTLPILSCVLLKTDEDGVTLTGSNLDTTVISKCPATVIQKQGAVCIPAKRFIDAVRLAAADEIEIEVNDKNVASLKSGSSAFKIRGLQQEEFPATPNIKGGKSFSVMQADLARALKRTAYAQCGDKSRYVLCGIHFQIKDAELTLAATDGRRLVVWKSRLTVPDGEFILPTEAVPEAARLLGDTGDVQITLTDSSATFSAVTGTLITKLIEGNFPNYKQVIPSEVKETATVNREEFIQCVQRAKVMTSEKSVSVKLQFDKNLVVSGSVSDTGEAQSSLAINYRGKPVVIACNPDYLLDFAGSIDDSEFTLGITDELSPILCTAKETTGVIMPMRLN